VSCNLDSPWNSPQPSGVAVETVRTQIKAIMAKLGVSRQVDLVVRLGEL
jgi:DNA-binding NarL/FixJ family response regulator